MNITKLISVILNHLGFDRRHFSQSFIIISVRVQNIRTGLMLTPDSMTEFYVQKSSQVGSYKCNNNDF